MQNPQADDSNVLPVHVKPLPVYPGTQVQMKLSGVSVQMAFSLHPPLFSAHSSTSVQCHKFNEIVSYQV